MVVLKNLFNKRQENIFSAAVVLMITYGVSMLLGILRERVLVSRFYFCCRESLDAYYAAFRLPDIIFQLVVVGALSAAFIPVFSEQLVKNESYAYKISSSLLNILLAIYFLLAGFIFLFASDISGLITGHFSLSQIELMGNLTRLMLFAQMFFLVSNFLTGVIQSHQRFIIPAIAPILYNLGIILSVLFFHSSLGIWSAAFGVILGAIFHLFIQIPLVFELGFNYQFYLDWKLPEVRKIFRLMLPRILGMAVYQIEATVNLFLATSLSAGSLTIFYLASKLMDLPVRLFGTSIGQASLPSLSYQKAKGDLDLFKRTLISSLNQIFFLSFPAMAAILILRIPLVRIAYGSRTFPWQATVLTGKVVALISLAIFSQSASELLVRTFYAIHNTKVPFLVGLVSVFLNISLGILSVFKFNWGILGLAAATSISSFLQFFLLFIFLGTKIGNFFSKELFFNLLKIIFSAFLTACSFWGTMKILDLFILDTTKTINLLLLTTITALVGLLVYFGLTKILRVEETGKIWNILEKLRRFGKVSIPSQEIVS